MLRGRRAALVVAGVFAVTAAGALAAPGDTDTLPLDTIKAAQRALNVKADGVIGPKTKRAIRRFQREHGLDVDGVLGPQTLRALGLVEDEEAPPDDREPASTETPPAPTGDAAATLERIAQCESGGDPTIVSADGRHRGKYQFDQDTWESLGGDGDPAKAPEAEQDARAAQLLSERGTAPWPVCGANA